MVVTDQPGSVALRPPRSGRAGVRARVRGLCLRGFERRIHTRPLGRVRTARPPPGAVQGCRPGMRTPDEAAHGPRRAVRHRRGDGPVRGKPPVRRRRGPRGALARMLAGLPPSVDALVLDLDHAPGCPAGHELPTCSTTGEPHVRSGSWRWQGADRLDPAGARFPRACCSGASSPPRACYSGARSSPLCSSRARCLRCPRGPPRHTGEGGGAAGRRHQPRPSGNAATMPGT